MDNTTKHIFIADDDADILQIISMMLNTQGYQVETSNNAYTIFNERTNFPDLILLDVWMSGIDGRDICSKLKANDATKNIPVVFISANSNIVEITRQFNA